VSPTSAGFLRLAAEVRREVDLIERVVTGLRLALAQLSTPPTELEIRGLAAFVHDLYTGVERIFERVATETEEGLPRGSDWHRRLLEGMSQELPGVRPEVVGSQTGAELTEYLLFRHRFRHMYGFQLEWAKLEPLLRRVPTVWGETRGDLERFARFLETAAKQL
jgi:hypothetical protein